MGFKKKLEAQCQRKLRNLYIQSEACTTKTCGKRNDVGYAHVYECGYSWSEKYIYSLSNE